MPSKEEYKEAFDESRPLLDTDPMKMASYNMVKELTSAVKPNDDGEMMYDICDESQVDACGRTALHWAARAGSTECAEVLLDLEGINVDLKDKSGMTALAYAVLNAHEKCASILIERGASVLQVM